MFNKELGFRKVLGFSFFAIFICAGTTFSQIVGSDFAYFKISSKYSGAQSYSLDAGGRHDGDVYHHGYGQGTPDTAQWQFIPVRERGKRTGYYFIRDRRHGAYLGAGQRADNNVYHQKSNSTSYLSTAYHFMWKLVDVGGDGKRFQIFDRKHNMAIVGGNRYDKQIYHQTPGNRVNSIWYISLVEGTGRGPREVVIGEKYVRTVFGPVNEDTSRKETILLQARKRNGNTRDSSLEFSDQRSVASEESFATSKQVTQEVWNVFTASVGSNIGVIKVAAENQTGVKIINSNTTSNSVSNTISRTFYFKSTETVSPGDTLKCEMEITQAPAVRRFTITADRVYANGRKERVKYNGTKRYKSYSAGIMSCDLVK